VEDKLIGAVQWGYVGWATECLCACVFVEILLILSCGLHSFTDANICFSIFYSSLRCIGPETFLASICSLPHSSVLLVTFTSLGSWKCCNLVSVLPGLHHLVPCRGLLLPQYIFLSWLAVWLLSWLHFVLLLECIQRRCFRCSCSSVLHFRGTLQLSSLVLSSVLVTR
jgi:hypothetical protein